MARASLNEEKVQRMIQMAERGEPCHRIAQVFCMSLQTVSAVLNGQRWQDVSDRYEASITEADLDRMIAEQLPTMPGANDEVSGEHQPHAVARGSGIRAVRNSRRAFLAG